MAEQSEKIRLDFLKGLGIHDPCPNDMKFIEAIPDKQLLKSLVIKARLNGAGLKILANRYQIKYHVIKDIWLRRKTESSILLPNNQ